MADEPAIDVKFNVLQASAYLDYNSTVLNRSVSLSDSVAVADGLVTLNNKSLLLVDTFAAGDSVVELVGGDLSQAAADTVTATDAVAKTAGPHFSETITGTDVLAFSVSLTKADTVAVTDVVLLDHGILLTDTMSAGDSLTAIIPFPSWNSADKVNTTLSSGNRKATNTGVQGGVRAVTGRSSGKLYFAVSVDVLTGGAFEALGIKLSGGSPNDARGYVADEAGYNFGATGDIVANGLSVGNAGTVSSTDIVGFAVDLDAGQFYVQVNGTWTNSANPTTGANAFGGISAGSTYFPATSGAAGTSVTFVSGTPPSGYASWN